MTVRTRLALQFLVLAAVVLGIAFIILHRTSAEFRESEFRERLFARGRHVAELTVHHAVSEQDPFGTDPRMSVRLPEEDISVFDVADQLLYRSDSAGTSLTDGKWRRRVWATGTVLDHDGLTERAGFLTTINGRTYLVVSSGKDVYGWRKLDYLTKVMLIVYLLGLALLFFVGRVFARRALTPLNELVREVREVGASDLMRRVTVTSETDELGEVAIAFNGLLERLEKAFAAQRDLIANASHELRTPMTVMSGQLEVLLLKERETQEYEKALRSILEDVQELSRLCDQLLLLAQAESSITQVPFNPVRLDELFWVVLAEVKEARPESQIHVDIPEVDDERDLTVLGNETLLRSALFNLLDNACKYASDNEVRVLLNGGGPRIEFSVANAGDPIARSDLQRIFQPFYRRTGHLGKVGHGIGLSLVARITALHGGTVDVDPGHDSPIVFKLRFEKAV